MNILIVSATSFEIAPLLRFLDNSAEKLSFFEYSFNGHNIYPLVTGVGALNTAFGMARYKAMEDVGVVFNVGLAGSYSNKFKIGDVVEVMKDRFADLGVEENDGSFTDLFDLNLIDKLQYPYADGWIISSKPKYNTGLPKAVGLTVNKVNGCIESIQKIRSKYDADIESMEGAGFLYACRNMDVPCHSIRAISNMVEPRNKENWKIELAIDNLNNELIRLLKNSVI
ncbi:MAG: futalosine hydrolase [Saprospiraceae bacterium]